MAQRYILMFLILLGVYSVMAMVIKRPHHFDLTHKENIFCDPTAMQNRYFQLCFADEE